MRNNTPRSFLFRRSCEIKNRPRPSPGRPCEKQTGLSPARLALRKIKQASAQAGWPAKKNRPWLCWPGLARSWPNSGSGTSRNEHGFWPSDQDGAQHGGQNEPQKGSKKGTRRAAEKLQNPLFSLCFRSEGGPEGPPKKAPKTAPKRDQNWASQWANAFCWHFEAWAGPAKKTCLSPVPGRPCEKKHASAQPGWLCEKKHASAFLSRNPEAELRHVFFGRAGQIKCRHFIWPCEKSAGTLFG